MIGPGTDARVMVATRPVDFRKGADSLAALVKAEYGANPFSGVVHVFRAKREDRVKLVWWDGTGLWLMAKRLEQGAFQWPTVQDGVKADRRFRRPHFWKAWTGDASMPDVARSRRRSPVDKGRPG